MKEQWTGAARGARTPGPGAAQVRCGAWLLERHCQRNCGGPPSKMGWMSHCISHESLASGGQSVSVALRQGAVLTEGGSAGCE